MKTLLIATMIASSFAALAATDANARSRSYAYTYCEYYKIRAQGAHDLDRKDNLYSKYYACLKEFGGR